MRIYDINEDGNFTEIAHLTGIDLGPVSYYGYYGSHWQKKIISSSSNKMLVEFRSDDEDTYMLFSAFIHYSPMPIKQCEKGLNMTMKTIQSPNYPDSYDNDLSCKWLISVQYGSHIALKFLQFDVRFIVVSISDFFSCHQSLFAQTKHPSFSSIIKSLIETAVVDLIHAVESSHHI